MWIVVSFDYNIVKLVVRTVAESFMPTRRIVAQAPNISTAQLPSSCLHRFSLAQYDLDDNRWPWLRRPRPVSSESCLASWPRARLARSACRKWGSLAGDESRVEGGALVPTLESVLVEAAEEASWETAECGWGRERSVSSNEPRETVDMLRSRVSVDLL